MMYLCSNLNTLSGPMIHEYLCDTAFPKIVSKIQKDRLIGRPCSVKELLLQNDIKVLTVMTYVPFLNLFSITPKSPLQFENLSSPVLFIGLGFVEVMITSQAL
jgi:hypothetical protein